MPLFLRAIDAKLVTNLRRELVHQTAYLDTSRKRKCPRELAGLPFAMNKALLIHLFRKVLLAADDEAIVLNIDIDVLFVQAREFDSSGDKVRLWQLLNIHSRLESSGEILSLSHILLALWGFPRRGIPRGPCVIKEAIEVVEGEERLVEVDRHYRRE